MSGFRRNPDYHSVGLACNKKMAINIRLPGEHCNVDINHRGARHHFHCHGNDQLPMCKSCIGESGRKFEEWVSIFYA